MFIQVSRGQIADADAVRAALHRWTQDVAAAATGWLGTTAGVTPDGTCISLVRFASEAAARHNDERPEQIKWWAETATLYTGDITVLDSTDVVLGFVGGSDDAGFVQVINGRAGDSARMRAWQAQPPTSPLRGLRPDMIGWTLALHDGDRFTKTVYLTSEDAARTGEQREAPPDAMAEKDSWMLSDLTFYDLREPWLYSPK